MPVTADSVINRVRDLIPDPNYDSAGAPAPGTDGTRFRVSTLYRFLDDAIKLLVQRTGWVVKDTTALGVVSGLPFYPVDSKWINVDDVYKDIWRLMRTDKGHLIWPNVMNAGKSLWFATERVTDHWEIRLFPGPNTNDPTTTLTATMSNLVTVATLSSVASFNVFGYMSVDSELIFYGSVQSGSGVQVLTPLARGQGGTAAATHNNAATVAHYTLWFSGRRVPITVTTATDVIELPPSFIPPLQTYVLARCRQQEQEFQEGARLMQEFDRQCQRIFEDPLWRENQGQQILAFGEPLMGALAYGRVAIPVLIGFLLWMW